MNNMTGMTMRCLQKASNFSHFRSSFLHNSDSRIRIVCKCAHLAGLDFGSWLANVASVTARLLATDGGIVGWKSQGIRV